MSVPIITSAWNYFHRIPQQKFTEVIIRAIAMSELMNDFQEKDFARLKWLRDNTHEKILQSIFVLDRHVDETKGNYTNTITTFKNGKSFNQDKIQEFLCIAIHEVYQIIYRNFKNYKVEEKLNLDDESTIEATTNENWLQN